MLGITGGTGALLVASPEIDRDAAREGCDALDLGGGIEVVLYVAIVAVAYGQAYLLQEPGAIGDGMDGEIPSRGMILPERVGSLDLVIDLLLVGMADILVFFCPKFLIVGSHIIDIYRFEGADICLQLFCLHPVVGVDFLEVFAFCFHDTHVDCRSPTAVGLVDHSYGARIAALVRMQDFGGVVFRAIVDGQHFDFVGHGRGQDRLQTMFDAMGDIIARDQESNNRRAH